MNLMTSQHHGRYRSSYRPWARDLTATNRHTSRQRRSRRIRAWLRGRVR